MNETQIQLAFNYCFPTPVFVPDQVRLQNGEVFRAKSKLGLLAKIFGFVGIFLVFATLSPRAYAFFKPDISLVVNEKLIPNNTKDISYQPELDSSLPLGNFLLVPSIGVKTSINEAPFDQYESALKKGVWRQVGTGDPKNRNLPTVLVAHRFGYLAWSNKFRKENSFFNLPKARVGDIVEVVWNQRKYKYAIYQESTGEKMVDNEADLILYTCKDLGSEVRIFKYAKLLII